MKLDSSKRFLFTIRLMISRYIGFNRIRLFSSLSPEYDTERLLVVMPPQKSSGWILDAICYEVASSTKKSTQLVRSGDDKLPRAPIYFFSHYMFYLRAVSQCSLPKSSEVYIFFTHFESDKHGLSDKDLAYFLDKATGIFCMNSRAKEKLFTMGVNGQKTHVVIGGADPTVFSHKMRKKNGYIGLSQSFYARKNPDLLLELVKQLPKREFLLVGKGWHEYEYFVELIANENFHYVETYYENYPFWYSQMTVFLSLSEIEGGPIPLLESMMCNIVPVVTDTGFAGDLINNGVNGFIFDTTATPIEIAALIEEAYQLDADISETVVNYSWLNFIAEIHRVIGQNEKTE